MNRLKWVSKHYKKEKRGRLGTEKNTQRSTLKSMLVYLFQCSSFMVVGVGEKDTDQTCVGWIHLEYEKTGFTFLILYHLVSPPRMSPITFPPSQNK